MQEQADSALGPYRALDLTDEKGLLCGKILASLGADVIKIENPGGDPARHLGPFFHNEPDPEKSLYWFAFNTSKRSITLDIETPEGHELFLKLVKTADFVIESFPPGYMDDLGLGYSVISQINPHIILTSITPFGQSGPYREFKDGDVVAQALGGLMYLNGDPDRPPLHVPGTQAYVQAGAQAAVGTLIAHYHRESSGEGQHVELSMQEAVTWATHMAQQSWDLNRLILKRVGTRFSLGRRSERIIYPCKDGYMAAVALRGQVMESLVEWMDSEGLAGDLKGVNWEEHDPDQETDEERMHYEEVVANFMRKHTKEELYQGAIERRVIFVSVNSPADLLDNPQLQARGFFVPVEHPELGISITYPGSPCRFSETPWRIQRRAPLIGEHNEEVYRGELGLSFEEIAGLKDSNVI